MIPYTLFSKDRQVSGLKNKSMITCQKSLSSNLRKPLYTLLTPKTLSIPVKHGTPRTENRSVTLSRVTSKPIPAEKGN